MWSVDQGSATFVLISAAMALLAVIGVPFLFGRQESSSAGLSDAGLTAADPTDSRPSAAVLVLGGAGVAAVLWILFGYAVTFGSGAADGFVGVDGVIGIDFDLVGLQALLSADDGGVALTSSAFQGVVAAVVAGLVAAALLGRRRAGLVASVLFVAAWSALVYFPVAGWVFNVRWGFEGVASGGWLIYGLRSIAGAGVVDFAGGLPIHVAVGSAALGIALAGGRRGGADRTGSVLRESVGQSIPQALLGGALLWFGWLGVTAGAEGAADGFAALALLNTIVTPATAMLAWILVEVARHGKATASGAAWGVFSGLVAVTAGAAYLGPVWSLLLGAATAVLCFFAVEGLSRRLPSVQARLVGINLVGGAFSLIYLGFFATGDGFIYAGTPPQLVAQVVSVLAVALYSATLSFLLAKAMFAGANLAASVGRRRLASRS
jgi:Amt family ammonium transporter